MPPFPTDAGSLQKLMEDIPNIEINVIVVDALIPEAIFQ